MVVVIVMPVTPVAMRHAHRAGDARALDCARNAAHDDAHRARDGAAGERAPAPLILSPVVEQALSANADIPTNANFSLDIDISFLPYLGSSKGRRRRKTVGGKRFCVAARYRIAGPMLRRPQCSACETGGMSAVASETTQTPIARRKPLRCRPHRGIKPYAYCPRLTLHPQLV